MPARLTRKRRGTNQPLSGRGEDTEVEDASMSCKSDQYLGSAIGR